MTLYSQNIKKNQTKFQIKASTFKHVIGGATQVWFWLDLLHRRMLHQEISEDQDKGSGLKIETNRNMVMDCL